MIINIVDINKTGFLSDGEPFLSFLRQSRLSDAVLGEIWRLADVDRDGKLDVFVC